MSWLDDLPAEFEECYSDCGRRRKHTMRWGSCSQGKRPEATVGFWHAFTAADGYQSIGQAEIPLTALMPWTGHLSNEQRWDMLEEAAVAADSAACVQSWQAVALAGQQIDHAGVHAYLSTGCLHGDLTLPDGRTGHEYCQGETGLCGAKTPSRCKFCQAPCKCRCHAESGQ